MSIRLRRTLTAAVLTAGLVATTAAPASAAAGAGHCGSPVRPVLQFDGMGHYVVTAGFTGAKRAVQFAFVEYIEITTGGRTDRRVARQSGGLWLRSSVTKRHVGTVEPGSSVSVVLGGEYLVADRQLPCALWGSAEGSWG